jgi:beta-glucosidase
VGPARDRDDQALTRARTANLALAREAARQSAVLLINDGVLPLTGVCRSSVAVVGELARTPRIQGGGSSHVVATELDSPLRALSDRLGPSRVSFAAGYRLDGEPAPELRAEAVRAAQAAEVTIVFLGLPVQEESEGADRTTIELPAGQRALLAVVSPAARRVVVVLANGGVVSIADWQEQAGAIIEGWLLGQAGGAALADLLMGDVSPSGRLAETIPRRLCDHPSHPTFPGADGVSLYGEGVFVGYRDFDRRELEVAFPFGHGLTYSAVEYADLRLERTDGRLTVHFTLTNTGVYAVAEIAQLYVGATGDVPGPRRPVRELRGFTRVALEPGESRPAWISFAEDALAVWDTRRHQWRVDPGTYELQLGASSRDLRLSTTVHVVGPVTDPPLDRSCTIAEWLAHPTGAAVLHRLLEPTHLAGWSTVVSPEVRAVLEAMPLNKLRSFGLGLDDDAIATAVAEANAELTSADQDARSADRTALGKGRVAGRSGGVGTDGQRRGPDHRDGGASTARASARAATS